jgi:hypothetical protein
MTLRPAPGSARHGIALDYEIAQEQASALGRLGRALETALEALAAHDRVAAYDRETPDQACGQPPPDRPLDQAATECRKPDSQKTARAALVQAASHALWCFMVQREACGLRDPHPVLRDYRVPAEVQNRMGMVITSPFPGPRRRPKTP